MDSNYLKEHLLDYVQLICGTENKHSCFCEVLNENRFVFGYVDSKGRQQVSRVTRQMAIILSVQYHNYVYYDMRNLMQLEKKKEVKTKSGLLIKRTK